PRLPVRLAGFNTLVIAASSLALLRGVRDLRNLDARGLRRGLLRASFLGVLFLGLQVVQWILLFSSGLSFSGTTYGATFYVLAGGLILSPAALAQCAMCGAAAASGKVGQGIAYSIFFLLGTLFVVVLWLVVLVVRTQRRAPAAGRCDTSTPQAVAHPFSTPAG